MQRIRLGYRPRIISLRLSLVALILFLIIAFVEVSSVHSALIRASLVEPGDYKQQKVFIVGIHWNNEKVLRDHWIPALIELTKEMGVENVFVSIHGSGSLDDTNGALQLLDHMLEEGGVPRRTILDETTHLDEISKSPGAGWIETSRGIELRRIPYLARLRNVAMEPLYELRKTGLVFDKILFLNDVVFESMDIKKLLSTRGGDYAAACGLDFSKPPAFYDTFALRDAEGHEAMMQNWPYFRSKVSRRAMIYGEAVPVRSCWNGVVVMDAESFYRGLNFRAIPDSLAKLHLEGSECCLIHADNPGRVWMNPNVRVGYNEGAYRQVKGSSWMSIAWGLWTNRLRRWFSSAWFREVVIRRRVEKWEKDNPGSHEAGGFCLIDEMQVLIKNGWAHV